MDNGKLPVGSAHVGPFILKLKKEEEEEEEDNKKNKKKDNKIIDVI